MSEVNTTISKDVEIVIDELNDFSSSINLFINNSAELFTNISKIFPEIENNIDNEIIEAQAVIDFFFQNEESSDSFGIFEKIKTFQGIIHRAVDKIDAITAQDNSFFESVSKAIDDVKNVINNMEEIRNVSEELKVYAINSITFANRAGESGKGYHILAKEYIQISDKLSKKVDEVGYSSDRVLSTFGEFDSGIKVLHDFYIESFSEVAKNFTLSSLKLEEGFKNLCIILQNIIDRVKRSKDPIALIMVDMQRQDIIQQQLLHVDESIKETLETIKYHQKLIDRVSLGNLTQAEKVELEDVYKLIHTICNLNIGQLERIQKDINLFNTKTASIFKKMEDGLKDIDDDKSIILDFFIGKDGKHSTINTLFDKPEMIIQDMFVNQEKYIIQKEGIIDIAQTLDGQTSSFTKSFTSIVSSTELISQMQLLTQIEINRNALDKKVAGTKASSLSVSEDFQMEVPEIIERFNKSLGQVITYVNDFISEYDSQKPLLNDILNELSGAKEIIQGSKNIVRDYLGNMLELTDDLKTQVNLSIGLFNDLANLENEVFKKVDVLLSIIKKIEDDVKVLNGDIDFKVWKIKDEDMRRLVDKYTVASERDTAMDIFDDLTIEDSRSSNITLF